MSSDAHLSLVDTGTPEHNFEAHYILKPGDIYVEAGAFWGRYGRIASKKVKTGGIVVLIEASPENYRTIEALIKRDGLDNVTLVKKAVWSSRGRGQFVTYGNPSGHRLAIESDRTNYPSSIVECEYDTLDNILLDQLHLIHVDLLACDVEGAEVEMVKGARELLNLGAIRNVALAAYHSHLPEESLDAPTPGAKEIMEILKIKGFKGLVYENGLVYGRRSP